MDGSTSSPHVSRALLAEPATKAAAALPLPTAVGSADGWALRFAGLPETPRPPFFLDACRPGCLRATGIPGTPGILPVASELIILRASKNRLTSALTSETSTPEPRAMRARREPSIILGLSRSAGGMGRQNP